MSKDTHGVRYTLVAGVLLILAGIASVVSVQGRVALARGGHGASGSASAAVPTPDPFTQTLMANLEQNGFQVSQGKAELYTFQDCLDHTYPVFKSCFFANPAAPYVLPVVKSWPEEYVDPAMKDGFVQTDPGYSATYRLDPREAIVIYGQMPPPGRYMGLQTWEWTQHGKWKTKDYNYWANMPNLLFPIQYLFDTTPPDDPKSQRVITFSALGDAVNNVEMEKKSGDPFGETRYFIITPSTTTDNAIRQAFWAQGVPDDYIFTLPVPRRDSLGPIGPLGMGKNAIDFVTAFRYAVPDQEYQDAAETWRANPPLTVLRVRAPASVGPVQRYKSLTFEPRTANSEAYLGGDLQDLVDAVCNAVSSGAGFTSTDCTQPSLMEDPVRELGLVGPYCREVNMNCLGDQQEAIYYASWPLSIDSGQVYAIVDTLATETGNATYVALSANAASFVGGVANLLDTNLKGSANIYDGAVGNTDKFFVHYFTKDCTVLANVPGGEENCTELSDQTLGDPTLFGSFAFTLRDYIAKGTERGPDSSKVLAPRVLTFTEPEP